MFDVRVHFGNKQRFSGCIYPEKSLSLVELSIPNLRGCSESCLWSVVFHELAHILDARAGKYKKFYSDSAYEQMSEKRRLYYELLTDKNAKKLMSSYMPSLEYFSFYSFLKKRDSNK